MTNKMVILGKISGVHGVAGWLKVFSYTRPLSNIFEYPSWQLQDEQGIMNTYTVLEHRHQGKKLLVRLEGVNDRDEAERLVEQAVVIPEDELPQLQDEYYWRDLVGLTVRDTNGAELGEVTDLMETGSNDVLLLKDSAGKSQAIPWLPEVIVEVDLSGSLLIVDWEPLS